MNFLGAYVNSAALVFFEGIFFLIKKLFLMLFADLIYFLAPFFAYYLFV